MKSTSLSITKNLIRELQTSPTMGTVQRLGSSWFNLEQDRGMPERKKQEQLKDDMDETKTEPGHVWMKIK